MGTNRSGRRRRFTPIAVLTGVVGVVLLASSMTNTLSDFTASITDSGSIATTAALAITEIGPDGQTECSSTDTPDTSQTLASAPASTKLTAAKPAAIVNTNADNATCTSIDTYGGSGSSPLAPGQTREVTVVMTNSGTETPDDFNLSFGDCSSTPDLKGWGDLCGDDPGLQISVSSNNGDVVGPMSADDLEANGPYDLDVLDPGESAKFTFTLFFSPKAPNDLQGTTITQPVIWTVTG